MANLTPVADWADVTQFGANEAMIGGGGPYDTLNRAPQQLLNRTQWLQDNHLQAINNIATLRGITPTVRSVLVKDYGAVGGGGGGEFRGVTGAAAGTYVDDGWNVIVPTGGNGSSAWLRAPESKIDSSKYVFGQEYLSHFHEALRNKSPSTAVSMVFTGDSTTLGVSITDTQYVLSNLVEAIGRERGHYVTGANRGQSGKAAFDWLSTYAAGDFAVGADLYVCRWGANDPFYGHTVAQAIADIRAVLTAWRASKTHATMSIVLMSPNSMGDTPNGRDEKYFQEFNLGLKQAARDFQCCFIDTYALLQDSKVAAGIYMDNPFLDGRAIHPLNVMNMCIGAHISEVLFPAGLSLRIQNSSFKTVVDTDLPSTYPIGTSIRSGVPGGAFLGLLNATVVTQRSSDGVLFQWAFQASPTGSITRSEYRTGLFSGGTDAWHSNKATITPANGWSAADTCEAIALPGGVVKLRGLLQNGTTTAGTTVGTLPAGMTPAQNEWFVCMTGTATGGATCNVYVDTAGNIKLGSAATATFLSLSGIIFRRP